MTATQHVDSESRPSHPIMDRLRGIPDPRKGNHLRHCCPDLLFAALLCVMCGYDSYRAFARFAQLNREWLRGRGCAFANGLPSRAAFRNLLVRLDPALFGECLKAIANDLRRKLPFEIVAVDGKAVRRGRRGGGKTPFIVNAWADAHGLVLGEVKVDEKSNEITAIPRLLRLLDLEGCIVTIDAAGCQKKTAGQIVGECRADYVLALKDNQKTMHQEMLSLFEGSMASHPEWFAKSETRVEKNSGRIESRTCWQTEHIGWFEDRDQWPGLRSVAMVEAKRSVLDPVSGQWQTSCERRLYISSLSVDPELALRATRRHWGVESMHWSLDVVFGEDYCRARTRHSAENRATVRRIALTLLNRWRKERKCGMRDAMMAAGLLPGARDAMLMA